jgi:hypothetical protein
MHDNEIHLGGIVSMPRPYLSEDELEELTQEERDHLEREIRQEMQASGGDAERIREKARQTLEELREQRDK